MNWFSFAIDPLLCYLERRLQGIPIYSLPVHGPAERGARRPEPLVVERYKVLGLADDVKPSVTSMEEFNTVERGATLFELATGNKLHRDPVKGKCKVLLLGRWRGRVQQEDIGLPHLRIVDSLAFIGVKLTASWQKTRKENMDDLQSRVKTTINSWKSGKFQPLVCRPFSVNTFCLSKIWFRTFTVDMREGDISSITSTVKQYIYQDMLLKPPEMLLFRPVQLGGLGLHNIKFKALASRLTSFMQTATINSFQSSAYHSALYQYYCCNNEDEGVPPLPPYYPQSFFQYNSSCERKHKFKSRKTNCERLVQLITARRGNSPACPG